MTQGAGTTQKIEIASLAERMNYLQALRVGLAVMVLAAGLFVPDLLGASLSDLLLVTAGYVLLSGAMEGLRRMDRGPGVRIIQFGLLVDGVFLAWITYSTGGVMSPLRFMLFVHIIAVTLLASYRTGMKIAGWHSLLSFVVLYAQTSDVLEVRDGIAAAVETDPATLNRFALFNIASLLLVAAGTAVFSSLNERELKRRKGDVEDLVALTAQLEETAVPEEIASLVLEHVSASFGFKRGVLLKTTNEEMDLLAYHGPGEAGIVKPGIDAVVERALESRSVQLVKKLDAEADETLSTLLPFAKNVIVYPLTTEGRTIGVLALEYPGTGRVERRVVDMASQFATHAAMALQNAWLLEQVQKQAETDALTGVANRRTFQATLEREMSRAARNGEQLTLAMFDIDHFKSLNDTYGHQVGDQVLQKVAAALVEASRDFDTPARYGGEEFAVILPSCSTRESLAVAERLRKSFGDIEGLPVEKITASSGVATFPTHAGDMDSLIKAADEALYESKRAGRDRVTRSRRRARARRALVEGQPDTVDVTDTPSA